MLVVKDPDQRAVRSPHVNLRDELCEDVCGLSLGMAIGQLVVSPHKELVQTDDGYAMDAMNMTQFLGLSCPYDLSSRLVIFADDQLWGATEDRPGCLF